MNPKTFKAWAILLDDNDGDMSLIGPYYFSHDVLPQFEGCRCALFNTRKVAREFFDRHIGARQELYKRPKVIRVEVAVKAI